MARPDEGREKLTYYVASETKGIIAMLATELQKNGPGYLIDELALVAWKLVRGDEPPPPPPPPGPDPKGRGGPRKPKVSPTAPSGADTSGAAHRHP
jgi:hypothetical protein